MLLGAEPFYLGQLKLLRASALHASDLYGPTGYNQGIKMAFDAVLTESMLALQGEHLLFRVFLVAD